jgi:protein-S-isoprenylcysteine O-methyltransferase Ste14
MHLSPLGVSALLWLAFIVYWSAAARNSAPTLSAESSRSRQVHVLLMYGALACSLAFRFPPLTWRWLPAWAGFVPLGLAIQIASAGLAIWARRHLGRNWSAAVATKEDHQLVRSGPYSLVRHPIYTGMLGMFLGSALVSGALHGLIGLIVMSAAYRRKIRLEERRLMEVFGPAYRDYQKMSGAVIPNLL